MNAANPPSDRSVTIIVAPRERFSCAQVSLESIYQHTNMPFELVYVDGGSPEYVRRYLEDAAATRGFKLIRTENFLGPNPARNLAFEHAHGAYIVFVDNDVQVTPGWLDAMITCAEETGAGVVTPLCFVGELDEPLIHMAGGELTVEFSGGSRNLSETHRFWDRPYAEARDQLVREPCGYAEFHCMLVRRQLLEEIGAFDEEMLAVSEHIDFSLRVAEAGHKIWFEPASKVTYLATRDFALSDLPYFHQRWSEDWTERSLNRLIANWNLDPQCTAVTGARTFATEHRVYPQLPKPVAQSSNLPCAQTNVQLFNQCIALGYPVESLRQLHIAYDLARQWFNGMYRPCGRPFLAHLVGTASILAAYGAPLDIVIAGMLHAVYTFGVVGGHGPGLNAEKRRAVLAATHPRVELWLHLYAAFDWRGADITALEHDLDRMALTVAKVVLIRLANDLEEHKNRSILYAAKASDDLQCWITLYVALARRLDLPMLAQDMEKTLHDTTQAVVPQVLRTTATGSYAAPR